MARIGLVRHFLCKNLCKEKDLSSREGVEVSIRGVPIQAVEGNKSPAESGLAGERWADVISSGLTFSGW